MKSYKLKHWVIVTETGAAVMAKVVREGTVLYENNPEIFELISEEKEAKL